MKTYGKTGAALLAAALLCAGGTVQAAEFTVNSQEDLTEEKGWTMYGLILAPTQGTSGNEVIIGRGETQPGFNISQISGAYSTTDTVFGNSVILESGMVYRLYGGYSENGIVTGNTATLSGGIIDVNVYGGQSENGDASGNTATIISGTVDGYVFGGLGGRSATENTVTISGDSTVVTVVGGQSSEGSATGNTVTISGGTVTGYMYGDSVYGGKSKNGSAERNTVTISGGKVKGSVYGGYSENGVVTGNTVTLTGTAVVSDAQLYGSNVNTENSGNKLVVDNWRGTVGGLHNFDSIEFQNVKLSEEDTTTSSLEVNGDVQGVNSNAVKVTSLAAGDYAADPDKTLTATITWSNKINDTTADVSAVKGDQWFTADRDEGGLYANQYNTIIDTTIDQNSNRTVILKSSMTASALTGKFIDANGALHYNSAYTPDENGTGQTLVIGDGFTTNVDTVAGAYAAGSQSAAGGQVLVTGDVNYDGTVYGGYSTGGDVTGNTVTLSGATASQMNIYGGASASGGKVSGNTLIVDGGTENTVKSVQNFETITFQNLNWQNNGVALNIADAESANALADTSVQVDKLVLANGNTVQAGDKMTFIQSDKDTGLSLDKVSVTEDASFSQGVATVGELEMKLEGETNNLVGEIKGVGLNSQTTAIAENRTAAVAFLNQGADIAADSLDLLGSDYKYGLRTFGAVYGSRSTWDAAGDLKINGWSEIVGLGNVHRKGDGDLSWGVFYENGTGNYRTWNEFNNEMFRGDGSLLYNGGGAAVRYQKDNGWYYEASVRAGTLSASMDNAVKDGNGQSYGFDSDSTYWGAHAGMGKVIETEQGEWNVYGKYFHTDIDGDSFNIAGDAFTFDSLTSDRLRIGARYTADKAKQWSLYYGLAWEYEFTGDSHMKAGQWDAPEQSLGGSTGIAEIGTVWQPDDSPWQANINLKGYAGEREGVSGMVQLAYTF